MKPGDLVQPDTEGKVLMVSGGYVQVEWESGYKTWWAEADLKVVKSD